jgi:hypothetical protein
MVNYLALLLVYFPNAQIRFSIDSYIKINDFNFAHGHLTLGRLSSYAIVRLQNLMGLDVVLDQQIFFYIYLGCLSACTVILFYCIFPKLNSVDVLSALLLNLALLLSFANVLIQEWSHYTEAYLVWGLGTVCAAYAVKFFSYSGKKRYALISFFLLFIGLNFYQIDIQLFVIFGAFNLILENKFCFTRKLFIRAAKLFIIAIFASLSNILILKGLQLVSIAPVTSRDFTTNQFGENTKIIARLVMGELSKFPYSLVGMMVWACIVLFVAYVIIVMVKKENVLSGIALMTIFGVIGFLSTFGLHLFSSGIWAVPRTLVGIAFIISALCVSSAYNVDGKKSRAVLLTILSIAFLVNVYHVQAMSINQYANNRLDQAYALNIAHEIDRYEKETGAKVKKIAFCVDHSSMYTYNGNIRYATGDMNLRAARIAWADSQLINYYAQRNLEEAPMNEDIYDRYFKDQDWDFFVPGEQMVFQGDTVYIAVY